MTVFAIEHVEVADDLMVARVRVAERALMRTSVIDDLAERLSLLLPGIARHRCECGSPRGVLAELADTETPHLLEHVTLEVMALAGSPRTLRGETVWDFSRDGWGVFEVRVGYDDDLVALGALGVGSAIVDGLFGYAPLPDVECEVQRLTALRG